MAAGWSSAADSGSDPARAAAAGDGGGAFDSEDVAIADLFQQSQIACHAKQQQQQQRRHNTDNRSSLHNSRQSAEAQLQPQPQPQRTQPNYSLAAAHPPAEQHDEHAVERRRARVANSAPVSVDVLLSGIPGPIRRLWLHSQRSSHPQRHKRRRVNAAMVDLTSDERADEWQRAADLIAHNQPSWRSMIAQHCSLAALIDSLSSSSSASSSSSRVPHLFVRVDSLHDSLYAPSALSSREMQQLAVAKQPLRGAGVLLEQQRGTQAPVNGGNGDVAGGCAGTDDGVLGGYHSAVLSDGRCTVTADVHDSLCIPATLSLSSARGASASVPVLSVGCYVLLGDVTTVGGGDGRPPHLVVRKHNVCAVQQPMQNEGDGDGEADELSGLNSTQLQDGTDSTTPAAAAAAAARAASSIQQPVVFVSAAIPVASSLMAAAACIEATDTFDMLDMGGD